MVDSNFDADIHIIASMVGTNGDAAIGALIRLALEHPSDLVREGAIFGLEKFAGDDARVLPCLRLVVQQDKREAVKEAAKDILECYDR